MPLGDDTLSFRARALAQAHPLSATAKALIDRHERSEAAAQPIAEIGQWVASAMLAGYCLRTVEEDRAGMPTAAIDVVDLDELDAAADRMAAAVRAGKGTVEPNERDEVIQTLDGLIASEIERRIDPWREQVGENAWQSFEEYIAHWTIKGYGVRAAEAQVVVDER